MREVGKETKRHFQKVHVKIEHSFGNIPHTKQEAMETVAPCTIPSIYGSPNSRAAARHLKAQKARRVRFAQHVKETVIESGWPDSRNNSFAQQTTPTAAKSNAPDSTPSVAAAAQEAVPVTVADAAGGSAVATPRQRRKSGVVGSIVTAVDFLVSQLKKVASSLSASSSAGNGRSAFARKALFTLGLSLVGFLLFRFVAGAMGFGGSSQQLASSNTLKRKVVGGAATKNNLLKL